MRRKRTKKRMSVSMKRHRDRILNAILAQQPLYIKDTGVLLDLEKFTEDLRYGILEDRFFIKVRTKSTPNMACIEKFLEYRIESGLNTLGHSNTSPPLTISGQIKFEELSTEPYETEAAKILYNKASN